MKHFSQLFFFPIRFNLILNLRFTCVLLPKRMLDFEDGLFNSCSELLKFVFVFKLQLIFGNFGYIDSSDPTNTIWIKRLVQKLLICRYTVTHALRSVYKEHQTPSRTIKGFYNLHINVEYLETLSLEGWTLSLSPCYILCDGRPKSSVNTLQQRVK